MFVQLPKSTVAILFVASTAKTILLLMLLIVSCLNYSVSSAIAESLSSPKYSSRTVRLDSGMGSVRGILVHSRHYEPVEVFRGIPYAVAPIDAFRFRTVSDTVPETAQDSDNVHIADTFGPVCPQRFPDLSNKTIALQTMTKTRYDFLAKFHQKYLQNQSEDCLTLNIYVPVIKDITTSNGNALLPVLVYVHGESFEWGTGNAYDGSAIAAGGHVIVVTVNYRLGILGFLKTKRTRSRLVEESADHDDFAIEDIRTSLNWLKRNIAGFGGDSRKLTVFGHDTGAALVHFMLISTKMTKGLIKRVILISGSALSSWGSLENSEKLRQTIGRELSCTASNRTPLDVDIAPCLRNRTLAELLGVRVDPVRFMPRFAVNWRKASTKKGRLEQQDGFWDSEEIEKAINRSQSTFRNVDLMLGTNSIESFGDFSEPDMLYGFEEDQRNRILRTYIRNAYVYHLNEIFSAVRNEYTDWEKPILHPFNIRDATMEALSDAHTVAPLVRTAMLHSAIATKISNPSAKPVATATSNTYFFHFAFQHRSDDTFQRLGTIRGDDLNYIFGQPLLTRTDPISGHNYSRQEIAISESMIRYFSNFVKYGNPNGKIAMFAKKSPSASTSSTNANSAGSTKSDVMWERWQINSQLYMNIGSKFRMKNHYRGHKMALWLNLVPRLHQAGDVEVQMAHHQFFEKADYFYAGAVRHEIHSRPTTSATNPMTDCEPNEITAANTITNISVHTPLFSSAPAFAESVTVVNQNETMLRELTKNKEQSPDDNDENVAFIDADTDIDSNLKTTLMLSAAIGSLLVMLNVTVFVALYLQKSSRERKLTRPAKSSDVPIAARVAIEPLAETGIEIGPAIVTMSPKNFHTLNEFSIQVI